MNAVEQFATDLGRIESEALALHRLAKGVSAQAPPECWERSQWVAIWAMLVADAAAKLRDSVRGAGPALLPPQKGGFERKRRPHGAGIG